MRKPGREGARVQQWPRSQRFLKQIFDISSECFSSLAHCGVYCSSAFNSGHAFLGMSLTCAWLVGSSGLQGRERLVLVLTRGGRAGELGAGQGKLRLGASVLALMPALHDLLLGPWGLCLFSSCLGFPTPHSRVRISQPPPTSRLQLLNPLDAHQDRCPHQSACSADVHS